MRDVKACGTFPPHTPGCASCLVNAIALSRVPMASYTLTAMPSGPPGVLIGCMAKQSSQELQSMCPEMGPPNADESGARWSVFRAEGVAKGGGSPESTASSLACSWDRKGRAQKNSRICIFDASWLWERRLSTLMSYCALLCPFPHSPFEIKASTSANQKERKCHLGTGQATHCPGEPDCPVDGGMIGRKS
jgi:hypothetical protein